ncbi:MAG: ATP-binding protein [Patescibacteria group bacterium]|nr:ATP-binding protein [Patescibacteria group bacterium]
MQLSINKIYLKDPRFNSYHIPETEAESVKTFPNVSKVNIFVGENNSGKSRFLRSLFALEKFDYQGARNEEVLLAKLGKLITDTDRVFEETRVVEFRPVTDVYREFKNSLSIGKADVDAIFERYENYIQAVNNASGNEGMSFKGLSATTDGRYVKEQLLKPIDTLKAANKDLFDGVYRDATINKVYIPVLRGLRNLLPDNGNSVPAENADIYCQRTKKDYFNNGAGLPADGIHTGLLYYNRIRSLLLGDLSERAQIRKFESFLSANFFEGKPVALIPYEKNDSKDVLYVKIGNEKEQPIHMLGDGIQEIIVLSFPIFLNMDKETLFFIEEPELYIHPGLQRTFLKVCHKFPGHYFFITTHSNHFLDITFDETNISIYRFVKILKETEKVEEIVPEVEIRNVSHGDKNTLKALGVRNSSVYLSNCTIWVEGVTDRMYIRHYLNLYFDYLRKEKNEKVNLKEDLHYSFVEYAGSNLSHWDFTEPGQQFEEAKIWAERLCGKALVIADQDFGKEEKHKQMKEMLDDRYVKLEVMEIENLVSADILKKVIKDYEKAEPNFKQPGFTEKGYSGKKLGRFIESSLESKNRKGSYAEESGTVTDKTGFADKVIKHTTKYSELTPEAQALTERVFSFIQEHNS